MPLRSVLSAAVNAARPRGRRPQSPLANYLYSQDLIMMYLERPSTAIGRRDLGEVIEVEALDQGPSSPLPHLLEDVGEVFLNRVLRDIERT